jgi:hypothetical protein
MIDQSVSVVWSFQKNFITVKYALISLTNSLIPSVINDVKRGNSNFHIIKFL